MPSTLQTPLTLRTSTAQRHSTARTSTRWTLPTRTTFLERTRAKLRLNTRLPAQSASLSLTPTKLTHRISMRLSLATARASTKLSLQNAMRSFRLVSPTAKTSSMQSLRLVPISSRQNRLRMQASSARRCRIRRTSSITTMLSVLTVRNRLKKPKQKRSRRRQKLKSPLTRATSQALCSRLLTTALSPKSRVRSIFTTAIRTKLHTVALILALLTRRTAKDKSPKLSTTTLKLAGTTISRPLQTSSSRMVRCSIRVRRSRLLTTSPNSRGSVKRTKTPSQLSTTAFTVPLRRMSSSTMTAAGGYLALPTRARTATTSRLLPPMARSIA